MNGGLNHMEQLELGVWVVSASVATLDDVKVGHDDCCELTQGMGVDFSPWSSTDRC